MRESAPAIGDLREERQLHPGDLESSKLTIQQALALAGATQGDEQQRRQAVADAGRAGRLHPVVRAVLEGAGYMASSERRPEEP